MSRYIASHKGATAGVFDTVRAAAEDFFRKYPKYKLCTVIECREGPGDIVTYVWGAPRVTLTRATLAELPVCTVIENVPVAVDAQQRDEWNAAMGRTLAKIKEAGES